MLALLPFQFSMHYTVAIIRHLSVIFSSQSYYVFQIKYEVNPHFQGLNFSNCLDTANINTVLTLNRVQGSIQCNRNIVETNYKILPKVIWH